MKILRSDIWGCERRVQAGILLLFVLALAHSARPQESEPFSSRHFEIYRFGDGVFAAIHTAGGYAIGNAGFVDLGDRTVVFDTFLSPEAARDLKRAAEYHTSRPVTLVVNSHAHNDHIRGNQVFRPGAEIISTDQVRAGILENEPGDIAHEKEIVPARLQATKARLDSVQGVAARDDLAMWLGYYEAMSRSHGELVTTPPTLTFDSALVLHGSRRSALLLSMGRGHTSSDVVMFLPAERILFAGDLVFHRMHPWLPDGDPDMWLAVLAYLKAMRPVTVVPGHGLPGDAEIVDSMATYISEMDDLARNMVRTGAAEVTDPEVPARFRDWSFPRFYLPNLRFMVKRVAGGSD